MSPRFEINTDTNKIVSSGGEEIDLYSKEGFKLISDLWLKVGWDQKHMYTFSWLGRPLIQIPEDALRIQEVICEVRPDVLIETGVAHGGSLVFYASIFKSLGFGRVIGVDIEIRPHNRKAIEQHPLFPLITLVESDSISPETIADVAALIRPEEKVMVILDSCHSYQHVLAELRGYSRMVSPDSYIVATDGSQQYLHETPRARREYPSCSGWATDNPKRAAEDFVKENGAFSIVEPAFPFSESAIDFRITHWPSAFLKRNK